MAAPSKLRWPKEYKRASHPARNDVTFHKFPLLPPEIRHRIWCFCLPRRVVEFDRLDDHADTEWICPRALSAIANRKPPVIMSVCREAYNTALHHGSADRTGNLATWLQPRLDRMLFYHCKINDKTWYTAEEGGHDHDMSKVRQLTALFNWAGRIDMPIAFCHLDLWPFGLDDVLRLYRWEQGHLAPQIAFLNEFASLGSHKSFPCVIATMLLHLTQEQAIASGLFGRLGEDICQLVDIDNTETIRRYYELWKPVSYFDCVYRRKIFSKWKLILAKDQLSHAVDEWQAQLQYVLLAAVWKAAAALDDESGENLQGIFSLPIEHGYFPDSSWQKVVETHPWVVATREYLPTVSPCISFRVCTLPRCMIETKTSAMKMRWDRPPRPSISGSQSKQMRKQRPRQFWAWLRRGYQQGKKKTPARMLQRAKVMKHAAFWDQFSSEEHEQPPYYLFF